MKKRSKDFALDVVLSLATESDRGCIIVGTSFIDDLMERLLRKSFSSDPKVIKDAVNPLFDGMGPLSTFASKIKMAYSLSLIDDNVYKTLSIFRSIRNDCAHKSGTISFGDQFIKDKIRNITAHSANLEHSIRFYPNGLQLFVPGRP